MCCVFSSSRWGVQVGRVTVSALETLIQACVRDGLSGAVARQQVFASHMLSQFGVMSVSDAGSSSEVVLPGGGSSHLAYTPRVPRVARQSKPDKKPAISCQE